MKTGSLTICQNNWIWLTPSRGGIFKWNYTAQTKIVLKRPMNSHWNDNVLPWVEFAVFTSRLFRFFRFYIITYLFLGTLFKLLTLQPPIYNLENNKISLVGKLSGFNETEYLVLSTFSLMPGLCKSSVNRSYISSSRIITTSTSATATVKLSTRWLFM